MNGALPALARLVQRLLSISHCKLAAKHLRHAKKLLLSQDPADVHSALRLLDGALKVSPHCDRAVELKAKALLRLRRYKDVASLLQEFIPSLEDRSVTIASSVDTERVKLLDGGNPSLDSSKKSFCFSRFRGNLWVSYSRKGEKDQWKYIVLGQACCHLGMMQDAMVLLSKGKRAALAAIRNHSKSMPEDSFLLDDLYGADSELASHLLCRVKFFLRRKSAGLAALEVGLYLEAARHFSKIIDGRRGTPQGFVAECCMYRATAYHAANMIVDALVDCNRALVLNPWCAESLSIRATLYEEIGCLADCLQDLEQLKALYESGSDNGARGFARAYMGAGSVWDFEGCIDVINSRLAAVHDRWRGHHTVDHHRVLGVSRGCTRGEAERAYLLLSLRHRPDKAASFLDLCELVDERNLDDLQEQASSLGFIVFRIIQRAFSWVLRSIMEEEMKRQTKATFVTSVWEAPMASPEDLSNEVLRAAREEVVQFPLTEVGGCLSEDSWPSG